MEPADLRQSLPPLQRLALAYAPRAAAPQWLGLIALDARLAGIVRNSREPMLAQLRLAWWREQLALPVDPASAHGQEAQGSSKPRLEPLLAALACWDRDRAALAGLTDGWEAMTGTAPLPSSAFEVLAEARAGAIAALAVGVERAVAHRMARAWALADVAGRLSHPQERAAAVGLAQAADWRSGQLPRDLKPLKILHGIAFRAAKTGQFDVKMSGKAALLALRIGILGR